MASPPYNGPHSMPGRIEAEDYDNGGEGTDFGASGREAVRFDRWLASEGKTPPAQRYVSCLTKYLVPNWVIG